MTITLNGKEKELPSPCTVEQLITQLGKKPQQVAVQVNLNIIKRDRYAAHEIQHGDEIEMLHFVGGGSPVLTGE